MNNMLPNRNKNRLNSIERNVSTVDIPALIAEAMTDYFYSSFKKVQLK